MNAFKDIRKIIRALNLLKLTYCVENKHGTSCYVNIFKGDKFLFVWRFSDHELNKGNWLPAGVINDMANTVDYMAENIRSIAWYIIEERNMSDEERATLWTNRYID
jgi:hypothetical protein